MKFCLALLVSLAISAAVNARSTPLRETDDLKEILREFHDLVPLDQLAEITQIYEREDVEFQWAVKFFLSENFRDFVRTFDSIEDVIKFYDYLQEAGFDVYREVNGLHDVLNLPLLPSGSYPIIPARREKISGGFAGFLHDVKDFLPHEHIKTLFDEKMETSPKFAEFVKRLRSPRLQQLVNNLHDNEEFEKLYNSAKEHGVDFGAIMDLVFSVFGLEFPKGPSYELHSVLTEFLALVPLGEVDELYGQYFKEDAEVQVIGEYIQTDDFRYLVQKVDSIKDVANFYDYLQQSGLAVYELVDALHEAVGIPHVLPGGSARNVRIAGGFRGLLADIKALLPYEDIKALSHEKLETSPAFARFAKRLRSPHFQELIDNLRDNEEFQKFSKFAKEHGVYVRAIMDLVLSVFGLEFPKGSSSN